MSARKDDRITDTGRFAVSGEPVVMADVGFITSTHRHARTAGAPR
jgi:hypothetical protein